MCVTLRAALSPRLYGTAPSHFISKSTNATRLDTCASSRKFGPTPWHLPPSSPPVQYVATVSRPVLA
ncbi:hypothetical protein EJ02DRAFT_455206 [Clathrospora elynae]|uniref:Uncharacterized protein n=2 Tax=Clathrospora elynae TaxID=706981 RepID=A0A6A5SP20_9PLEO|nr:hypothetical protein EJ02DRAFT_455206 [Clathrospora elynae]